MKRAYKITLPEADAIELRRLSRGRSAQARVVLRAKIVLLSAEGVQNKVIASRLATDRNTAARWRFRFARMGIEGIMKDAPRPGRRPTRRTGVARQIVERTIQTTPQNATHWTTRTLAAELNISHMMVQRVWKANNLKPHLTRSFKVSNDPNFVEKLVDIVGLYLNPPEHALVLCTDEKSQIQALDRTQKSLPIYPGRRQTMTHDYKRNGTTTLFAAIEAADGRIIGKCMAKHRHQEWIKFMRLIDEQTPKELDLHLIADNYATHKHPRVALARTPPPVPHALYADRVVVAQSCRTMVPRPDRQADTARLVRKRRGSC